MDELVPNPHGCTKFNPSPFKKEKCKDCGRPWNEHKDAIDQAILQGFLDAKQREKDAKLKAEADAKEKARAKAAAKKKAQQAVEDEWFFDGAKDAKDDESDDDMGFRMFAGSELDSTRAPATEASGKPLNRVVNLLDFNALKEDDEDDVTSSAPTQHLAPSASSTAPRGLAPPDAAISPPAVNLAPAMPVAPAMPRNSPRPDRDEVAILQSEIEHLQMMLASSKDEMSIQVEIVRDEVAEKQKLVENLRAELAAAKAEAARAAAQSAQEVEGLRVELEAAKAASATASGSVAEANVDRETQAEADRVRAELDASREACAKAAAEVERLRAELETVKRASATAASSVAVDEGLAVEADAIRAELEVSREACAKATAEANGLRDELENARRASKQSAEEAERLRGETDAARQASEKAAGEADGLRTEVDEFRTKLVEADAASAKAAEGFRLATSAASAKANAEVDRLRAELDAKAKEANEAAARAAAEVQALQAEVDRLRARSAELEQQESKRQSVKPASVSQRLLEEAAGLSVTPLPSTQASPKGRRDTAPGLLLGATGGVVEGIQHRASCPSILDPSAARYEEVGKASIEMIRDIRINAERHLAWIRKRVKQTHPHQVGGPNGVPQMDHLGGG